MVRHSIVIPVYDEELGIERLHAKLSETFSQPLAVRGETWEVVYVNDGSRDGSVAILEGLCKSDPAHVRLVSLSRNFGHQMAITAGIDHAGGDTVTFMDADLQDPPEVVLEMIEKWREGFDVVYGVRSRREDESAFKLATAALFYRTLRWCADLDIPASAGDFRLLSRRAARATASMRERHRFMRAMTRWIGFRQVAVSYVRRARSSGETKYPLSRMTRLAWDAITGYSLLPLRLAGLTGIATIGLGLIGGVLALSGVAGLAGGRAAMFVIAAVLLIGGVQLLCLGILGEYVGRVLEEGRRRPLYVVDYTIGVEATAPGNAADSR